MAALAWLFWLHAWNTNWAALLPLVASRYPFTRAFQVLGPTIPSTRRPTRRLGVADHGVGLQAEDPVHSPDVDSRVDLALHGLDRVTCAPALDLDDESGPGLIADDVVGLQAMLALELLDR